MDHEHCNCGHHHNAEMAESKIQQAFEKYNFDLDDEQVKREVEILLDKHLAENDNVDVKKFLLNSVELTTLKTTDSEDSVMHFVEKVNKFDDAPPASRSSQTLPHICHHTSLQVSDRRKNQRLRR